MAKSSKCRRRLASPPVAISTQALKPRSGVFSVTTDWFRTASSVLEHGLRFLARRPPSMSALGHKRKQCHARVMSDLPLKVDIRQREWHVRLVPIADIGKRIGLRDWRSISAGRRRAERRSNPSPKSWGRSPAPNDFCALSLGVWRPLPPRRQLALSV